MVKLEDLTSGFPLFGLKPSALAIVATVGPIGESSAEVFCLAPSDITKERLLNLAHKGSLVALKFERSLAVDGACAASLIVCEFTQIELTSLFRRDYGGPRFKRRFVRKLTL
jgi:hypothetical protein